jgi:hypothetical protein
MRRFPAKSEIGSVFSVILFVVYSYAIYRMVWYIPSWLGYLSAWDIVIIGAYSLVMGMFEILCILAVLLGVAFVLPARVYRANFAAQSLLILSVAVACALVAQERLFRYVPAWDFRQFITNMLMTAVAACLLVLVSYFLVASLKGLRVMLTNLSERFTVFLYVYLPLFGIALIVVVLRNIF